MIFPFKQRTKEAIKMPTVDIQVPMVAKKAKPTATVTETTTSTLFKQLTGVGDKGEASAEVEAAQQAKDEKKSFNFVVMTKKGNKTQYHNLEVPVASEFAQQFRAREEVTFINFRSWPDLNVNVELLKAEKMEKEELKKLTLNINERIEQEELQGSF